MVERITSRTEALDFLLGDNKAPNTSGVPVKALVTRATVDDFLLGDKIAGNNGARTVEQASMDILGAFEHVDSEHSRYYDLFLSASKVGDHLGAAEFNSLAQQRQKTRDAMIIVAQSGLKAGPELLDFMRNFVA